MGEWKLQKRDGLNHQEAHEHPGTRRRGGP